MIEVPGGHRAAPGTPPFPGGVAVSHLRVYDSASVDGLAGGTPHCHTACTEAYAVIGGRGRVATLGGDGYRETPLEAGSFAWFTPAPSTACSTTPATSRSSCSWPTPGSPRPATW